MVAFGAGLRQQSGKLAANPRIGRRRAHRLRPGLPHPAGDVGLGAVIDDHGEFRMPVQHGQQCGQLPGAHQRIEAQAQPRQRRQRAADVGAQDPRRVRQVLQHGTNRLQQRIAREARQRRNRVGGGQVHPAHDALDHAVAVLGYLEQELGLGHGRRGLHEYRGGDPGRVAQRREIRKREIAINFLVIGREPAVIAPRQRPHVVVRIDLPGRWRSCAGAGQRRRCVDQRAIAQCVPESARESGSWPSPYYRRTRHATARRAARTLSPDGREETAAPRP